MYRIIILQGPPASGKSTWAREFVEKDENCNDWIIVNKDSIRNSLGKYWVPRRETLVSQIEESISKLAIKMGYNIIIDATNLNPKTIQKWENFGSKYNLDIQFKRFYASLEECLERDSSRKQSVGENTIKYFFKKYNL